MPSTRCCAATSISAPPWRGSWRCATSAPATIRCAACRAASSTWLRLFGAGESLAEIADELKLSYRTVANSVSQIKRKLNVATNARLLRLAIEHMPEGV